METDRIKICDFSIFSGRNIYSHRPVARMVVDIGRYGETPTSRIPGFNEKLLEYFPGLATNCCGLGYPGGFLERLRSGTYLAHVLEHVVLEMQYMVGYDVRFGKTREMGDSSRYYLVYEFQNEICGLECGKASVFILNRILEGKEVAIAKFLDYLKKVSREAELGPSTEAIVKEAKARGIPVARIGDESLVRLGYGRHSRLIESTMTDASSCISVDISCNKQLTKFLLREHRIPVPYGRVVYSEISAAMVAGQIGPPVVVKPFDGNQGKGVRLNLSESGEIRAAFREAARFSRGIIVEKYIRGRDYRVFVVGDRVCAVSERLPASVLGDGVHTVRELIDQINRDPDRGEEHEKPLTKIRLDEVSQNVLKRKGLTAGSVPERGRLVALRENGNLSTGGIAIDCTDCIHPENAEIAVRAAQAVGIDIAGIDIVAEDISKPIAETGGAVVEVNTAPGIRMHLYPSKGKPRNVAKDIVDLLFPDRSSVRFPLVSVTGTNGKTTVVRLIQHVLSSTGLTVGMTSTSGTFIGEKCVCRGDNSGPRSARALLSDKSIDAAVLETARGGILREGLGYDLADVGVITNITDDHLGLDGVENLEDLAFVKSLVAEAVKKGGAAVLNAEDGMTRSVLRRVKARVFLFGRARAAVDSYGPGYSAVYTEHGSVWVRDGLKKTEIVRVGDIPVTAGGLIGCNVENVLAAAAALYALKVPVDFIRRGLLSFSDNPGRFQLYSCAGFRVMLDYGHNFAGYRRVLEVCAEVRHRRLVGVIGMPGDRTDESIRKVGKLCAKSFDRIFIKEDHDLRGREKGEVAGLFHHSILESGFDPEKVVIESDELQALQKAVSKARKGDLIVAFYEKLEPLQKYLETICDQVDSSESKPMGKVGNL